MCWCAGATPSAGRARVSFDRAYGLVPNQERRQTYCSATSAQRADQANDRPDAVALPGALPRFVAPAEGIMRARVAIEVGSSSLNAAGGGSRATLARQRPDVCAAKMMASWRVALASSHRRRDDLRMDFRPSIRPSDRPRSDRRIGLRLDDCWTARPSPAAMLRDTWLAMLAKDEVRNS